LPLFVSSRDLSKEDKNLGFLKKYR